MKPFKTNPHKKLPGKAIIGKKIGMTQVFSPEGKLIPVTVIKAGPCPVVQKKTINSDGYEAVQVGFDEYPERRVKKLATKPVIGHFKKASIAPCRRLRELRLTDCSALNVGDIIKVDVFKEGEKVDVSGVTKGHGFTGAIYRWGQHTGPMAHGSKYHRGVGSMGANSTPSRVFKNKHMPGHYGVEKVTIQNLSVVRVDAERGLLLVRGAVPGPNGGYLTVRDTVRA